MLKENKFIFFIAFLISFSCGHKESPDFYLTNGKLKYKFHDVSTSDVHPNVGDYIALYVELKNTNDSTLYRSNQYSSVDLFYMDSLEMNSILNEGFNQLVSGDSACFYISLETFYNDYLETEMPNYSINEDVEFCFRIVDLFSTKKDFMTKFLSNEQMIIESILDDWNSKKLLVSNYGKIHWIQLNNKGDSLINVGDKVAVFYSCHLHDGELIYKTDSLKPDEFIVGLEGQMIEGFDLLLQHLNYGDHVNVIIPSILAFKQKGGVNGQVPPNVPLIINLEILNAEN
jgi:hypothetical protein